jgi:hypothetical protein
LLQLLEPSAAASSEDPCRNVGTSGCENAICVPGQVQGKEASISKVLRHRIAKTPLGSYCQQKRQRSRHSLLTAAQMAPAYSMLRPLSAGLIALAVTSTVAGYVAPSAASTFAAGSSTALCIRGRAVCGAARHCSQVAGLSMQDVSTRSVQTTNCLQLHHCILLAAACNMCTASQFLSSCSHRCLLGMCVHEQRGQRATCQ